MIEKILSYSLKNKLVIILFTIGLIIWGILSLRSLKIDAIPDITNNQVQIISVAPSLAVQEVESFITSPIEVAVANIPDIIELRSISRLGLSVITVVFEDKTDIYWARQQLNEKLREAHELIPEGVADIELAPISTGLGEIYQYMLTDKTGNHSLMELRSIQDWIVRREMLGTKGVADINSYGGFVKQYEIGVNPQMLKSHNLTLTDVFEALEKNNENTGSAYIDKKPQAYFIRGIGLVKNLSDIENIVVKTNPSGFPVLIRDIANVQFGNATRYGALIVDTSEAVGGVVMMLKGANSRQVIKNIEDRMETIKTSLPEGVEIEAFLNRSDLVGRATTTVSKNLIEGALIVIFILVLFLGNLRAGLIVASVIPLSMLFAICMMNLFGISGNLMSLGAIDFGIIVDGAVIVVEAVVFRLHQNNSLRNELSPTEMNNHVYESGKKMMNSAIYGQIIILIVYFPILALSGIEGKMFRPMAEVVLFALTGAAILCLTYVPVVSSLFLKQIKTGRFDISSKIMYQVKKLFNPVILYAISNKYKVIIAAVILFTASLFIFKNLGGEFIPQLEEGDLAAGVITLQGGSLSNTIDNVIKANKILLENFPEIKHTICKIGTAEIPTDPTPMETGDYVITLKDKSEWTSATNREELIEKMQEKLLVLAGVKFEFQQPIQMRFNELLSGSRQDIAVKLFGDDLNVLAEKSLEIEEIIRTIEGAEDISTEKITGLSQISVEYKRDKIALYGLSVSEINNILKTSIAGYNAGTVYENENRYGLAVRLAKEYRSNIDNIRQLSVASATGELIPLEQIADISIKSGPAQVSRENTKRRITVGFNVRQRDIETVISEVKNKLKDIKLDSGYYIDYGGQFKNLQTAKQRLMIAVPVSLMLIFFMLYLSFRSVKQSLLIYSSVPLAAIGGIIALWIRDMNFSISAGIGFIALFGVAVLNGIVLISEFNRLEKEGIDDIKQRVLKGLESRLRPVFITALVASFGFLPMALSESAGAEVQKPLATVVIGGLISATILTLIVLPVLYIIFQNKNKMNKVVPVIILMILLGYQTQAQEKKYITSQEAVQLAIDSNLLLKSAKYTISIEKAMKGTSVDLPKTEIEAEYGQLNTYAKDNSFNISQSFNLPGYYINRYKLANNNIKISEIEYQKLLSQVVAEVKQTYWELSYLYSKLKFIKQQDSIFKNILRASELKVKIGESNSLEMISARSSSMEINNKLLQLNSDIQINKQKLRNLLNITSEINIVDTLIRKVDYEIRPENPLSDNPEILILDRRQRSSELEKRMEVNKMLPEFSVGYFSQTINGEYTNSSEQRIADLNYRFEGFRAGINIPLFIKPYLSSIKAAKLKEKYTEINNKQVYNYIMNDYNLQLADVEKYRRSLEYYELQGIKEADEIIKQADLSYKEGELDYIDYIINLDKALSIKLNYIETINLFNQSVINIELITGKVQ